MIQRCFFRDLIIYNLFLSLTSQLQIRSAGLLALFKESVQEDHMPFMHAENHAGDAP